MMAGTELIARSGSAFFEIELAGGGASIIFNFNFRHHVSERIDVHTRYLILANRIQ